MAEFASRPAGLLAVVALLGLLACASQAVTVAPGPAIGGLRIENRGSAFISAVRLIVPATGNFVSCGNIAPGNSCATTFPEQRYSGNPVEVSWSQGGQIWSTGELSLQAGAEVRESGSALVQVVIIGAGQAGVVLLPLSRPGEP